MRDELLAVELFSCLAEAKVMVADWREDYNERRPHSALAMKAPAKFARAWRRNNPPGDPSARGVCRVAGTVARPGSHGTVLVLFAHGSSGRRVANPAAGRLATSIYPHSSASCSWAGVTISLCARWCSSTSETSPRSVKNRGRRARSTCGVWLSAHSDLRP